MYFSTSFWLGERDSCIFSFIQNLGRRVNKITYKDRSPRIYIHMINIALKPCETLKMIIYYHAPKLTFTVTHFIDIDPIIALSLLVTLHTRHGNGSNIK